MARWLPRCQSLHANPFSSAPGPAPAKMPAPWLAGSKSSNEMGLTVNLLASEEPWSYKQVGAPPPGHSLSPEPSLLPQEAGSTSISGNLWQGSRAGRWSGTSRCGVSGLQMQQGREMSPRKNGRNLLHGGSGPRVGGRKLRKPYGPAQPEPGQPPREEGCASGGRQEARSWGV